MHKLKQQQQEIKKAITAKPARKYCIMPVLCWKTAGSSLIASTTSTFQLESKALVLVGNRERRHKERFVG